MLLKRSVLLFLFLLPGYLMAQDSTNVSAYDGRELVIGTKVVAPFILYEENEWRGLSIDLWHDIARDLNFTYRMEEHDLPTLINKVHNGELDAAIAAISITDAREQKVDFTFPYFQAGLGIAVHNKKQSMIDTFMAFFNWEFFSVIGALLLVLLVFGLLVWIFERKANKEQFGGSPVRGIAQGLWWSAVTMTTVGYGDKAPVTIGGRIIALVWMFMALIIISSFTAAIASSLTVNRMEEVVAGPEDLDNVRVGSVASTSSAEYLDGRDIGYKKYESVQAALEALQEDNIDAVVYDAPVIKYLLKEMEDERLQILPYQFNKTYYGIALPQNSPLREMINIEMLKDMQKRQWTETLDRYLEAED
ncbi:MAG: transporter substrate-binding domain-containing protein [Cyclobacteriaceae bacterium]